MLTWIVAHPLAYPALEVLHIVGIGLLVGNLVLLELRVWGLGGDLPVQPLARLALGLAVLGFALAGASGLLMFAAQAGELLANRAFVIKMGLLMLAGTNASLVSWPGLFGADGPHRAPAHSGLDRDLVGRHRLRPLDRLCLSRGAVAVRLIRALNSQRSNCRPGEFTCIAEPCWPPA